VTDEEISEQVLWIALENAKKHSGPPNKGAVLGAVLAMHPDLKPKAKEISSLVSLSLKTVELMDESEKNEKLGYLDNKFSKNRISKSVKEKERRLPQLPFSEKGVVMRFAPNPSGPLHLGHARAALLNDEYVREYGGKYILRIEDTDPKRVDPDAYRTVLEDIDWLGLQITDVVYQSSRLSLYYENARQLIEIGGAYACTCDNEEFRLLKGRKEVCPCRSQSEKETLDLWDKMEEGFFKEGEISLRLRTQIDHPDPAMRDFPLFRILNSPSHPRVEAHLYPLMNFSVSVDDHYLGVTHVIRGKDHIANTCRQKFIFDYFGWQIPYYRHYGRMGIEGVVLSTSDIRKGINEGRYTDWDDIRLGTLRALGRRGITPAAVRRAVLEIGIGETDIQFSWENLFAKNKEIIDPVSHRYFFVPDPVAVKISGTKPTIAKASLQPSDPLQGSRNIAFHDTVYIPSVELNRKIEYLRLKDLFNILIKIEDGTISAEYAGNSLEEARSKKAPIIQWLPYEENVPCTLLTPEGVVKGLCEQGVLNETGKEVQFERVGFVKIDKFDKGEITAYFTHR